MPVEESPVPEADFEPSEPSRCAGSRSSARPETRISSPSAMTACLLIDQHVAHERVLFDGMRKSREERGMAIQGLVVPVTLSLSAKESAIVSQRLDDIRKAGFDLEAFGGNTYVMRGSPGQRQTRRRRDRAAGYD